VGVDAVKDTDLYYRLNVEQAFYVGGMGAQVCVLAWDWSLPHRKVAFANSLVSNSPASCLWLDAEAVLLSMQPSSSIEKPVQQACSFITRCIAMGSSPTWWRQGSERRTCDSVAPCIDAEAVGELSAPCLRPVRRKRR
jgi:hypothetical protein